MYSIAYHGLDTELPESSDSTDTLKQALRLRQHLFVAKVEKLYENFDVGLT